MIIAPYLNILFVYYNQLNLIIVCIYISNMIMRLRSQISSPKLSKFFNYITFFMLCIIVWNLYKWFSNERAHEVRQFVLKYEDIKIKRQIKHDVRRSIINKYKIYQEYQLEELNTHMSKNLYKKRLTSQKRVNLGRPQIKTSDLLIYVIKSSKHSFLRSYSCSIISSVNTVSKITVLSIQSLLANDAASYIILLTKQSEDIQLHKNIRLLMLSGYDVKKSEVSTDSQYNFITPFVESCSRIVYTFGNNLINNQMALSIVQQTKKVRDYSLLYSSAYLQNQKIVKSQNLTNVSLSTINQIKFYRSIYIFDSKFLSIITPLNFAYYSKYTLEQMLLIPVLAIVQQSGLMISSQQVMFSLITQYIQFSQFVMRSQMEQQNSMCFVSYPSNPFNISTKQFERYLNQILRQKPKAMSISVIPYFPYHFGSSKDLITIFKKLFQINRNEKQQIQRIRLRIKDTKAVASLAVYESAYYFCPNKSIIISSRHNVLFSQIFTIAVSRNLASKFHYYHVDYDSFDSDNKNFSQISPNYLSSNRPRNTNLFHQVFRHFQIFKSDFLKTHVFYTLKNAEVDFYQTEASFAIPLIQVVNWRIGYIKKKLAMKLKINKLEGLKSMINFYKYEVFFIDNDISLFRFNRPQAIGNGVMGGTQNNYFLKILLTQLILPEGVKYQKSIPFQTGSFVARKTLNDEQFFKILGLSFHLLLARPYVAVVSACGGENKTFDSDQKVYEVLDYQSQKIIKIGLPCKQYPQSYLTNYSPLSRTWLFQKRDNIN